MAYAVTHILLTIVVLDFFRHYIFGKHRFPRYLLVIGGIAGLLPDIDIPLSWAFSLITGVGTYFHGVFSHSIIWPVAFLGVGIIFYNLQPKKKNKSDYHFKTWAKISYVISFGWFFHLVLDCLYGGYTSMLWPLQTLTTFCPEFGLDKYAVSIDAIILVLWLAHEELHQKIKDYF